MPKTEQPEEPRVDEQDDARIDLSSLDPSRDEIRWAAMVKQVAKRAAAARATRRRPSVLSLALSWGRPVLAAALVLVAATWAIAGARVRREASLAAPAPTITSTPAALQVATWASTGEAPETTAILTAMGEEP